PGGGVPPRRHGRIGGSAAGPAFASPRAVALARELARLRGTSETDELLACRHFRRTAYWQALAGQLGVRFLPSLDHAERDPDTRPPPSEALRRAECAAALVAGERILAVAPSGPALEALAERLRLAPALADRLRIVPPEAIRAFLLARHGEALVHYAVNRLARAMPAHSARMLATSRNRRDWLFALFAGTVASFCAAPAETILVFALLLSFVFSNAVVWKLAASLWPRRRRRRPDPKDAELPSYTVLVALYREAAVVPDLVRNLDALLYPRSKLQVLLVVEADDGETRSALEAVGLPANFMVVPVPPAEPRTKPKALVYALPLATGDQVVVYDAEDRPEPDQLRKAAAAFRAEPRLGCVQAALVPENRDSWFARMFALEYAAHFEVLLPALACWRVPIPLGGTSNHFPRRVLQKVGAWDPFNVTEDADLGVRLARFGYLTGVLDSRTYEEAPVRFAQWLPQRRRWIKGWIQTALVAMAEGIPRGRRLSVREAVAVHAIITGGILGLLFYPLSFLALVVALLPSLGSGRPWSGLEWATVLVTLFNGTAFSVGSLLAALRGAAAARAPELAPSIATLPFYWVLQSLAAWQALWQFFRTPFRWEKTEHGVSRRQAPVVPPGGSGGGRAAFLR
ncbi:glycosyltransferase, partial [Propylenella binzhouense]